MEFKKRDKTAHELQVVELTLAKENLQSERDSLQSERDSLQSERDSLRSERDSLRSERDSLQSERDSLQSEQDSLLELTKDLKSQLQEARANNQTRFDLKTNQFFVSKPEMAIEGNLQLQYPEGTEVMNQFWLEDGGRFENGKLNCQTGAYRLVKVKNFLKPGEYLHSRQEGTFENGIFTEGCEYKTDEADGEYMFSEGTYQSGRIWDGKTYWPFGHVAQNYVEGRARKLTID